jgi:hypothetical protein
MKTNTEYIGHFELEMNNGKTFYTEIFSDGVDIFTGKDTVAGVISDCNDFSVCIREHYSESAALEYLHEMITNSINKKRIYTVNGLQ